MQEENKGVSQQVYKEEDECLLNKDKVTGRSTYNISSIQHHLSKAEHIKDEHSKMRRYLLNIFIVFSIALASYIFLRNIEVENETYQCQLHPRYVQKIYKDLQYFSTGITAKMIRRTKNLDRASFFKVRNKKYVRTYYYNKKLHPEWIKFMEEVVTVLPDTQFTVNFYDEPRIIKNGCDPTQKNWHKCACTPNYQIPEHAFFIKPCSFPVTAQKLPLFSFTTLSDCFADILFPSNFHFPVRKIQKRVDWSQKTFKAIWRGGSTGTYIDQAICLPIPWRKEEVDINLFPRTKLFNLCKTIKDCDVRFGQYTQCAPENCTKMQTIFGKPNYVKMQDQLKYKILIDIDGNTYSRRFPEVLSSGSVVMKIHSFEDIGSIVAKAWVHYLPVRIDLSDFEEKLRWAKENDEELQRIASRGLELSKIYSEESYKCYVFKLITEYSKLLVSARQYKINQKKKQLQMKKDDEFDHICNLQERIKDQIRKDLATFDLGIPPSMMTRAKAQKGVSIVSIKDHQIESYGKQISEAEFKFFQQVAYYLPDLEFVFNSDKQNRLAKLAGEKICDLGYKQSEPGVSMDQQNWSSTVDLLPIFSLDKTPECLKDIILPTGSSTKLEVRNSGQREGLSFKLGYEEQKCYAIKVLREYSRLFIPQERYKARLRLKEMDEASQR